MLTKDLLRVSRRGGGYQPQFVDGTAAELAARVIGCYQGHVGKSREALQTALAEIERESDDFKLVRGFAKLLDRDGIWEVRAEIDPLRAREAAFAAGETVGVVTEADREKALEAAATRLDATPQAVAASLYADREQREILGALDTEYTPETLRKQYNLSLAQTAMFDATEVRIRSDDPKRIISAIERLRLLYEIRTLPSEQRRRVAETDREIIVTGPDALFRHTRRYGTRFARLLRSVAGTANWRVEATIDDRGTERTLVLTDDDLSVPGIEPITEVTYDSDVERSFATRFESLDLDWNLVREPDPIEAGEYVVIPDFAFDWKHSDFRVYFEIVGFWTPEYVEKKLDRLDAVEMELLVAVDESLGVGDAVAARDHRVIPYTGAIDLKTVRNALREYERTLREEATASLPEKLTPDEPVTTLEALAAEYGVSEGVIEQVEFPAHERIGRTLVEPSVLEDLAAQIEGGISSEAAQTAIKEAGIEETSAALAALGYRIEWEGLSGGTVRER